MKKLNISISSAVAEVVADEALALAGVDKTNNAATVERDANGKVTRVLVNLPDNAAAAAAEAIKKNRGVAAVDVSDLGGSAFNWDSKTNLDTLGWVVGSLGAAPVYLDAGGIKVVTIVFPPAPGGYGASVNFAGAGYMAPVGSTTELIVSYELNIADPSQAAFNLIWGMSNGTGRVIQTKLNSTGDTSTGFWQALGGSQGEIAKEITTTPTFKFVWDGTTNIPVFYINDVEFAELTQATFAYGLPASLSFGVEVFSTAEANIVVKDIAINHI